MAAVRVTPKPPEYVAEKVPSDAAELFEFAARWRARIVPTGMDDAYVEFHVQDREPVSATQGSWVVRHPDGKVERLSEYRFKQVFEVLD